jgi:hypothetical protein
VEGFSGTFRVDFDERLAGWVIPPARDGYHSECPDFAASSPFDGQSRISNSAPRLESQSGREGWNLVRATQVVRAARGDNEALDE